MKHSGKARKAAFKLILFSLVAGCVLWALIAVASVMGAVLATVSIPVLIVGWVVFSIFTLFFFRDPAAHAPNGRGLVVSPAHGKVDVIDTTSEPEFMGGECRRISIFLSVMDVHVQNAPVGGKVVFSKYSVGQFLNALRTESSTHNENLLLGFESSEDGGRKVGVRLVAGVIARRIVPYVQQGEEVARGDRISLIQFGSRAEVYLPLSSRIQVKLGDHVKGGETIAASFE